MHVNWQPLALGGHKSASNLLIDRQETVTRYEWTFEPRAHTNSTNSMKHYEQRKVVTFTSEDVQRYIKFVQKILQLLLLTLTSKENWQQKNHISINVSKLSSDKINSVREKSKVEQVRKVCLSSTNTFAISVWTMFFPRPVFPAAIIQLDIWRLKETNRDRNRGGFRDEKK